MGAGGGDAANFVGFARSSRTALPVAGLRPTALLRSNKQHVPPRGGSREGRGPTSGTMAKVLGRRDGLLDGNASSKLSSPRAIFALAELTASDIA